MPQRRFWRFLAVIVLAAFALRLTIAAEYQGLSSPPKAEANPDQVDYEALGWRLAAGGGYSDANGNPTAVRAPGTPVLIEMIYIVFGHEHAAVRIVFCVLSALTCLVAGLLAAELFGNFAGLCAAALLALLPNHAYYAQHMLSEVPYALVIAVACLWTATSRHERGLWPFDLGAGLMFGLAFLTRPQSVLCLPLVGLLALAGATRARGAGLLQFARIAFVFALVVAPWIVRNELQLGTLAPNTLGGHTFWGAHNEVVTSDPATIGSWMPVDSLVDAAHPLPVGEAARSAAAWGYGLDFVRAHLAEMPRLLFWKLVRQYSPFFETPNRLVYWSFALAWTLVFPLFLVGLWLGLRHARASTLLLLVPLVSTLASGLVFYGAMRFRDGDAALYVVLAAAALAARAPQRWKIWVGEPVPTT